MTFKPRKPRVLRAVKKITITTKYDIEQCAKEVERIAGRLKQFPIAAAMHSKRLVAFIVQTHLNSQQLMDSLGDTVNAGCIDRVWVETPGADVVANLPIDPLVDRVKAAYADIRKFNNPDHMHPPKARQIFVNRGIKDGERSAAVKMGIKPRRVRKATQNPHKP